MKPTEIAMVTAEIRLVYGMNENGEQVIATSYSADGVDESTPDYFTGILMFEIGKLDFLRRHNIFAPGDREH